MDNEFRVSAAKSRLDLTGRFQQTPRYEVQLNREIANKLGFADGDLIEIKGNRATAARIISTDKDGLDADIVELNDLMMNNARVSLEETVTIRRTESKTARKIVLAPIGKHLKKSELLRIVAKKSFLDKPFVEGDVTYLRSKIMRYLLGSVTWMRVIKTDPGGVVVATEETVFDVISDPVAPGETALTTLPDIGFEDDFCEKELSLDESEWERFNTLLELGLFSSLTEVITFFLREGIRARSDIFEKSVSVMEQLKQLKQNVTKAS